MTTIKIKSSDEASQGPFVIIEITDFDREKHEPYDDESAIALDNAVAAGVLVPTVAELLAARAELQAREAALAERERSAGGATGGSYNAMSKDELHAALKEKGIDFPSNANKAELIALLSA